MKSFARNLAASLLVVSLVYTAVACSSGNGGDGSVAGDYESFVNQLCAEYMPCCTQAGKPADGKQCRALYGAFAPGGNYDAVSAGKCLDEVRAASKTATFCDTGMSYSTSPSCRTVFGGAGGTRKPGETCSDDDDCALSTEGEVECRTFSSSGMDVKKCQVQAIGKAGDSPCIGTVDGNVTYYSGSSSSGEPPTKGYLCHIKDGLRCDSTSGACKAIPKVGEACDGSGSTSCTEDAYCDTTSRMCVARKAAGTACTSSNQCAEGTYCSTMGRTCTTAVAVGGACTTTEECGANRCVNGKCEKSGDLTSAFLCGGG